MQNIFALFVCTVHLVVHCSETGGLAIETKELCCDPCTFSAVLGNVLGMYGHGLAVAGSENLRNACISLNCPHQQCSLGCIDFPVPSECG